MRVRDGPSAGRAECYRRVRGPGRLGVLICDSAAMRRLAPVLTLLAALVATSITPPSAGGTPFQTDLRRLAGADRSLTAVAVSQAGWQASTEVLLATAQDFPDALGSTPLAARLDAPLLLLKGGELTDPVLTEIRRLGATRATILGGPDVVAPSAENQLAAQGVTARRIAGANRYETAAQVAIEAGPSPKAQAVVASGEFSADALTAGSLAGGPDRLPVLLAAMGDVPDATMAALGRLGVAEIMLIGGTGILRPEVEAELTAAGMKVARLAGADRFATSARVATEAFARIPGGEVDLLTASGTGFADALAAGPLVARLDGVVLLVPPDDLARAPEGIRFVRDRLARLVEPRLLGGESAVNGGVEWQLRALLGGDPVPTAAFGDAVYRVGDGFMPGTYRVGPSGEGCYWERLRGFSGAASEIIANDLSVDPMVVTVKPTDAGFRVSGCSTWTASLSPADRTPAAAGPFVDGTWLVGRQMPAGSWRATGGPGCFWQRLSGFGGEPAEVIASGTSATVTLLEADLGFRSRRCGSWVPA